jgi:hypothetical protein
VAYRPSKQGRHLCVCQNPGRRKEEGGGGGDEIQGASSSIKTSPEILGF